MSGEEEARPSTSPALQRAGSVSHAATIAAGGVTNPALREELVRLRRVFQERWVPATSDSSGREAQRLLTAVDRVIERAFSSEDHEPVRLSAALAALRMGRERIGYFEKTRGWRWLVKSPVAPVLEDYWERIQRVFDAAGLGRVTTFVGLAQPAAPIEDPPT